MQIDPALERQAMEEGLAKFPSMKAFAAKLMWRALHQGGAFQLTYETQPPRDHPDAWEFQNAVVDAFSSLGDFEL
ncbi:MAG: hypothetical protein ABI822_18675, partial [Bryobacteraceae bacterium]